MKKVCFTGFNRKKTKNQTFTSITYKQCSIESILMFRTVKKYLNDYLYKMSFVGLSSILNLLMLATHGLVFLAMFFFSQLIGLRYLHDRIGLDKCYNSLPCFGSQKLSFSSLWLDKILQ